MEEIFTEEKIQEGVNACMKDLIDNVEKATFQKVSLLQS